MKSAVEADLGQLNVILALQRRLSPEIDTSEIAKEIGERLREELDYRREAKHMALYRAMLVDSHRVHVPEPIAALSTERLLTMTWLEGNRLLDYRDADLADRNLIAAALFQAWWMPFARYGVIHGDPHLGNYTVFEKAKPAGGDQPSRLRLHPHLPAALREGGRRPLSRASGERPRADGGSLPLAGASAT